MPKQKAPKGATAVVAPGETITDARFASFATDPRFRLPSKKQTRTKIDKRFSRMLKDDDFINTAKVDRYGRKLDLSGKKRALQRLYQPEEEDEDDEDKDDQEFDVEDKAVARELRRADAKYDPARGGGFSSSEDDSDDDENDDGGVEVEEPEFPGLHMEQAGVPMGEVTSRIAVVNLDWDNIRAVDLMAVFSSFIRTSGKIEKLSVYKSEFGKERMEREEMEGPPREIFAKKAQEEREKEADFKDESEDEEELEEKIKKDLLQEDKGEEFDSTALRQYQLERLRYYYAVVVCSDKETAHQIYESTDGTEYLSSANFFDLRFIPGDVNFDDKPRDECNSVPPGYRPAEFVTDALQHSKVKLTWDAEDTSRKDVIKRAFSGSRAEIAENDLKAYIGSDNSEDEEEDVGGDAADGPKLSKRELARRKMRAALGLPEEPTARFRETKNRPIGDMEITFIAGLSSKEKGSVFENAPIKEETTAEAYIRKEKERKARRKEKAKALRDPAAAPGGTDDTKEQQPDLGFDDPFFATDEVTREKAARIARKEARRLKREAKTAEDAAKASERAALELLMVDNSADAPSGRLEHFDMNEIARVEKQKKQKKTRKKRPRASEMDADGLHGGLQEGFEMDVADPRFKAVFESHEFAIDPSNPKFKGTEGMKKLLAEGRKRKAGDVVSNAAPGPQRAADSRRGADLKGLVESLKKKARR